MADALASVRGGYDRWAAVYDHDANPLQALEGPIVRRALGDVRGLTVLDLGCGTGRHALWLACAGARVTAVDFSEGMLAEARGKPGADQVRWLCHDLHEPLPFAGGEFDLVVSGLVLEHLRELDGFFSEIGRVLKRQGDSLAPRSASGRPAVGERAGSGDPRTTVGEGAGLGYPRTTGRAVISAMHPAMFLRGSQARFTDPTTGEFVQPGSIAHSISEFVMSVLHADLPLRKIEEFSPDAEFSAHYPRAEKYIGWPMLVVMQCEV